VQFELVTRKAVTSLIEVAVGGPTLFSRLHAIWGLGQMERSGARAGSDLIGKETSIPTTKQKLQMTLFEAEKHPVIEELESLDITSLTPIEALMKLDDWARRIRLTCSPGTWVALYFV